MLFVIPLIVALGAFVKDAHGFVGTADLHLQKVGLVVIARGTDRHGPIDIGPRRGAAQYVVDLLAVLDKTRANHHGGGCSGRGRRSVRRTAASCRDGDGTHIGTRGTIKAVAGVVVVLYSIVIRTAAIVIVIVKRASSIFTHLCVPKTVCSKTTAMV